MGPPTTTATTRSAYARSEQSLLRSFSAVHRSPVNAGVYRMSAVISNQVTSTSDGNDISNIESRRGSQLKRDLCGRAIRSSLRGNRRYTLDTTLPSPKTRAVTDSLPSIDKMPALPFSKNDNVQPLQRKFHRARSPAKKSQQQCPPLVANMAQETAHKELHLMGMATTSSSSFVGVDQNQTDEEKHHQGFRRDYSIGETIRSSSHMILPLQHTSEHAIQSASNLNKHDFAFVKRSDGSYSYAILAYRSMEPIKGTNNSEECMVFAMSDSGSTKMVRKHNWSKFVRLPSMEGLESCSGTVAVAASKTHSSTIRSSDQENEHSVSLCQEVPCPVVYQEIEDENDDDCVLPSMISFVPQMDDDCSLISSVSERARSLERL